MCEQADERLKSVGASAGFAQNGMYVLCMLLAGCFDLLSNLF